MARSQRKRNILLGVIAVALVIVMGFALQQTAFLGQDFKFEENTTLGKFSAVRLSTMPFGDNAETHLERSSNDLVVTLATKNTFSSDTLDLSTSKTGIDKSGSGKYSDNGPGRLAVKTAVLTKDAGISASDLQALSITFSHSNSIDCAFGNRKPGAYGGQSAIYLYSGDQVLGLWASPQASTFTSGSPSTQTSGTIQIKRTGDNFTVSFGDEQKQIVLKADSSYDIAVYSHVEANECERLPGGTQETISITGISVSKTTVSAPGQNTSSPSSSTTTQSPKPSQLENASPVFGEENRSWGIGLLALMASAITAFVLVVVVLIRRFF